MNLLALQHEQATQAGRTRLALFSDQLTDSVTLDVLRAFHTNEAAETSIAGSIRQLVRATRAAGAGISVHIASTPMDRSVRLLRCLARAGSCQTIAAVVLDHDAQVEKLLRQAGIGMYLVWPDDREFLSDLAARPSPGGPKTETSTSRREGAKAHSRLWDRL